MSITTVTSVPFRFHVLLRVETKAPSTGLGRKLRPNFALFSHHVKIRGRVGEIPELTFQGQPATQSLIYAWLYELTNSTQITGVEKEVLHSQT